MKKLKRETNGITLVALVITIIILLILAGIAIAALTGDNGLFARTNQARTNTLDAQNKENATLEGYEDAIDKALGEEIYQVRDQNPGILEIDGDNLVINSIEDLVFFSYDVTNGNNYEGQTVTLGLSLDFNSDKSYVNPNSEDYAKYGYSGKLKETLNNSGFISIGTMYHKNSDDPNLFKQHCFNGEFDGNGYKIYNVKIEKNSNVNDDETFFCIGFFNCNYGIIKNLIVENADIKVMDNSLKYSAIGTLSGDNNGNIINCGSFGKLNVIKTSSANSNIGGLVGSNNSKIECCFNGINVATDYQEITTVSEARVGGLVGANEENGLIENSYNIGNVTSENKNDTENIFTIEIGGIAGKLNGEIKNSYTIGMITNIDNKNINNYYIGSLVGLKNSSITNCHYLVNTVFPSKDDIQITVEGEEKTSDEMKESNFVEQLNEGNKTNIWKISSNLNQGYPILYWQ